MTSINRFKLAAAAASFVLGSGVVAANTPEDAAGYSNPQEWNFRVYLNDDPIGFHNFRLDPQEDGYRLRTEARFEVDFLFFTAYRYRHENLEVWEDGCLQRIESRTNDNGDEFRVVGSRDAVEFELTATGEEESLEADCVRTFAYWDLDKLKSSQLLNAQTGDYVSVNVERVGRETVQINGRSIDAYRYRVDASDMDLELWYSPEGEWLKLTSNIRNGRQLRYELGET